MAQSLTEQLTELPGRTLVRSMGVYPFLEVQNLVGNDRQKCGHAENPRAIGSREYARREGTFSRRPPCVGEHAGLTDDVI